MNCWIVGYGGKELWFIVSVYSLVMVEGIVVDDEDFVVCLI